MSDQSQLWGHPVSFWDLWGFRLMITGAILGAAAIFISFASSFVLYWVADTVQREAKVDATKAKDAFDKYKLDSDQKISEANARGEEAKAEAAKANEHAKSLDKAVAEANAKALEAKLELEKYKAPRALSPEQQERIIAAIKPFAGQEYALSVASGSEASNLLCLLDTLLQKSGWVKIPPFVGLTQDTPCGTVGFNTLSGVHIRFSMNPSEEFKVRLVALHDALNAEGITTTGGQDPKNIPNNKANVVLIMVGAKP